MKALVMLLLLAAASPAQEIEPPPPLTDEQRAEFFKFAFQIRSELGRALEIETKARVDAQAARNAATAAATKLDEFTANLAGEKPCELRIDKDGEPDWNCTAPPKP